MALPPHVAPRVATEAPLFSCRSAYFGLGEYSAKFTPVKAGRKRPPASGLKALTGENFTLAKRRPKYAARKMRGGNKTTEGRHYVRPLAGGQRRGALAGAPSLVLAIRYIFDNILNFAIKNSAYPTNYIKRNVFILCEFYHSSHRSPDFLPELFPRHSAIHEQV